MSEMRPGISREQTFAVTPAVTATAIFKAAAACGSQDIKATQLAFLEKRKPTSSVASARYVHCPDATLIGLTEPPVEVTT